MACPFCALGCRDGSPQIEEVNRNWRFRQLIAHPDHSGGSTEASTFLNQTREYAIICLRSSSTGKPEAINCQRHGTQTTVWLTIHTPNTTTIVQPRPAATCCPPLPPSAQTTDPHTMPSYPDPWDTCEQANTSTPEVLSQHPQPPPFTAVPQPRYPPQQVPSPVPSTPPSTQHSPHHPSRMTKSADGTIRHSDADGAGQRQHTKAMEIGPSRRH